MHYFDRSQCYHAVDYGKINPIKYVPALVDGDFTISDSLAIILVCCGFSGHS